MITSQAGYPSELQAKLEELQNNIAYRFQNLNLLVRALTHKSYDNENPGRSEGHNEVLEFLGDAVLDLSLGHYLIGKFPGDEEGSLSKKRASLVNESTLSVIAGHLGLEELILLGRGEKTSGGSRKPRLLASALEAVLGAVFLDSGFDQASQTIHRLFAPRVETQDWSADFVQDY
ncbi:MAG TPA: ribonuclease III domain-containing protein, partial [Bdellovibrionales bacterium]|nr:ribonuclease III domain-containing protein [Bdellovibrionales bacterium]